MIYVDLLVIEDLIMNYCVLIGTGLILNRITHLKKVFLSAVIGCIPLTILFLNLAKIYTSFISLIFSVIMSLITFGYKDIKYTIRNIIYIYFISIFLAGSLNFININFLPHIKSYLLNVIILIITSPIITYIYIKSLKEIKTNYSNYYQIDIYLKGKNKITVNSYLDTGIILNDPYTKKPIIILKNSFVDISNERILYVPYNTINGSGLLKCIKPEKIYIHKVGWRYKLLIGLIEDIGIEGADCILNKELLERI